MSLVAYGSSDESSEEEDVSKEVENVKSSVETTRANLSLPAPKDVDYDSNPKFKTGDNSTGTETTDEPTLFKNLPKPKHVEIGFTETEDDVIPPKKESAISQEKIQKKNRSPVKISLPSLSEFKDVDEEQEERKKNRIKPSEKGTGLFAILPPPRGSLAKATIKNLIPDAVKKVLQPLRTVVPKQAEELPVKTTSMLNKSTPLTSLNYDSDSDDDSSCIGDSKKKVAGKVDFFSLSSSEKTSPGIENTPEDTSSFSEPQTITAINRIPGNVDQALKITGQPDEAGKEDRIGFTTTIKLVDDRETMSISDKTLTSNVVNLPREEIILKNKAEVGPKLPVPEQEYNIDSQGNVAFDEKAIEYLCGKRGVKRKNKDFDEANIIEINGEDIKPDEREWLVKALTEEPAERPVSMESAGPSTQSRKKHQITYLAHQAKAMEVELKNQWAQNRVTRKQTQSKYGF